MNPKETQIITKGLNLSKPIKRFVRDIFMLHDIIR